MSCFFFALLSCFSATSEKCSRIIKRKEIREMSRDEFNRYINALHKLNSRTQNNTMSVYDIYSKTHLDVAPQVHGTPQFLPWHRIYIKRFEEDLMKIDNGVSLPFWDWSADYLRPHTSSVLSAENGFGGTGDELDDHILNEGPFSRLELGIPSLHYLRRSFINGTELPSFSSPNLIVNLLLNITNFREFSERLELMHNYIHYTIGGMHGDLFLMYSPNDPIFFLHHAFIDTIWAEWQKIHPSSEQYNGDQNGRKVLISDEMYPFGQSVQHAVKEVNKCVVYSNYKGLEPQSKPLRSANNYKPRFISLPEDFLKMNNFNVTLARIYEKEHRAFEESNH